MAFPPSLTIAVDVDGVITEALQFFAVLTAALRAAGHTVYVLSDFDEAFRGVRTRQLADLGIEYDRLILTRRKTEYFEDLGMDYALDDEPAYYFPRHEAVPVALVCTPPPAAEPSAGKSSAGKS